MANPAICKHVNAKDYSDNPSRYTCADCGSTCLFDGERWVITPPPTKQAIPPHTLVERRTVPDLDHVKIVSPDGRFQTSHIYINGQEIRASKVEVDLSPKSFPKVIVTLLVRDVELDIQAEVETKRVSASGSSVRDEARTRGTNG